MQDPTPDPVTPDASPRPRKALSRRNILRGTASAFLGLSGLAGYAHFGELHWIHFVDRPMAVRNLPRDLEGKTLVQLSDLHVGKRVDPEYLRSAFAQIANLRPDILVMTGDTTDTSDEGIHESAAHVLDALRPARLGTFAIFGNHDYGLGWVNSKAADGTAALYAQRGARLLRDERVDVKGLSIVGLDDLWGCRFNEARAANVIDSLDTDAPAIVLAHNPDLCDLPIWNRYRSWILSGHTHGGQCRAPFLPPLLLPVKNRRYVQGEYALAGDRTLYINPGIGHLLGFRFMVRPEITRFTLTRA